MGCGGSKSSNVAGDFGVSEKTVEEFVEIERNINDYERRHIVETLEVRRDQMSQLTKNLQKMEKEYSEIVKKLSQASATQRDRGVRNFLMTHDKYDEMAAYENADQVAALNRREILKKELDGTKHHITELKKEIDVLEYDMEVLEQLYEKEDKLLDEVFEGQYGSEDENKLENQLDHLQLKKQAIEEANFKWRQSQVMVEYAVKQLGTAIQKWKGISKIPSKDLEARYKLAEETRNNLIAAGQNLQGAHRYLPHINFPYCNMEEVEMLSKATSYVFTDMQAPIRIQYATEAYDAAHRRCAALLQWFNEIINKTIKLDLQEVKDKTKKIAFALRRERLLLIADKIKEVHGKDIDLDLDVGFDNDSEADLIQNANDTNEMRGRSADSLNMRGSCTDLKYSSVPNAPSPMPLEDLAPQPSREELFGNKIRELTKAHQLTLEKLNKEMEMKRDRSSQNLDEKLSQRRVHRMRMNNHVSQQEQLLSNGRKSLSQTATVQNGRRKDWMVDDDDFEIMDEIKQKRPTVNDRMRNADLSRSNDQLPKPIEVEANDTDKNDSKDNDKNAKKDTDKNDNDKNDTEDNDKNDTKDTDKNDKKDKDINDKKDKKDKDKNDLM